MPTGGIDYFRNQFRRGHLERIDDLPPFDDGIASALDLFVGNREGNRQGLQWLRTMRWVENFLFLAGRHYIDDILTSRLVQGQSGDFSLVGETMRSIPRPTTDLLGRYIETNVALFTENRPIPRVEPKSDRSEDQASAELSQLTIEYLWEALNLPHIHRQLARLVLTCGVAWLETIYDPTEPRRLGAPVMVPERESITPDTLPGAPPVQTPIERLVPLRDDKGNLVVDENPHFGDIRVDIVSPFEMYVPAVHRWDQVGWVMREYYAPRDDLIDRYRTPGKNKTGLTKRNGWDLEVIDNARSEDQLQSLPVWWWERLGQLVEGSGQTFYAGAPELWKDYCVVRVFDRKPNAKWPRGRTIITVGNKVLFDSPKNQGARAFNPKWPTRWHPYTIYRWESMPATDIWCRSLVTKLLPKIKRINSIDTTEIMYRRTVPIAAWVLPVGTTVAEDMWTGKPGPMLQYDVRRTGNAQPQPVFPPPFPESILVERQQQVQEMEVIAGTEEILRGQRPTGVNSAMMVDVLRKQALASRSATLQGWEESQQHLGSSLLQEQIKHIDSDPLYAERLRILAREKHSRLTISNFSGADLSDNVDVRIDITSMALVSKEAREAKAIEFIRYAGSFMAIPEPGLRNALVEELGFSKALKPQGADYERVKKMISWVLNEQYGRVIPLPEDDPYIFHDLLVQEYKAETFWDLKPEQQQLIIALIDAYRDAIQAREEQRLRMMVMMAQLQSQLKGGGGGGNPFEGEGQPA